MPKKNRKKRRKRSRNIGDLRLSEISTATEHLQKLEDPAWELKHASDVAEELSADPGAEYSVLLASNVLQGDRYVHSLKMAYVDITTGPFISGMRLMAILLLPLPVILFSLPSQGISTPWKLLITFSILAFSYLCFHRAGAMRFMSFTEEVYKRYDIQRDAKKRSGKRLKLRGVLLEGMEYPFPFSTRFDRGKCLTCGYTLIRCEGVNAYRLVDQKHLWICGACFNLHRRLFGWKDSKEKSTVIHFG